MLETRDRRLLLESLRPPPGYELSEALGTTFTLDLMALLSAPLAFTLFDVEDASGKPQTDPLALLEALRRHADHVHVFCQAGYVAEGMKSRCGIEAVLGRAEDRGGLRDLLRRYPITDVDVPGDPLCRLLEDRIAAVRTLVAEAGIVASVAPSAGLDAFDVTVTVPEGMRRSVLGLSELRVRPSTLARDRALTVPDEGGEVRFSGGTFDSLTSFFVVKAVVVERDRSMEVEFAINVPVEGMPADRRNRLMRATLGSRSKVLRFLMLLLSDGGIDARLLLQPDREPGASPDGSGGFLSENDLLESMLRALDRDPARIDRIAQLVEDLKSTPDGAAMLPEGLESLLMPILEVRRGLSP